MRVAWLCLAILTLAGQPSCSRYPTEQEVQDENYNQEGSRAGINVFAFGIPQDMEFITYFVLPVLVEEPNCAGGDCELQLDCTDFVWGPEALSIFDFSYAFVATGDLQVDSTERIDLVIDSIVPGRMLIYLEAYGWDEHSPLAWGCGHGQAVENQRDSVRVRLVTL